MADILVGAVLFAVIRAAINYIVKAKKRGVKCIGCPYSGSCHKKSCGYQPDTK